jgi:Peptidase family M28
MNNMSVLAMVALFSGLVGCTTAIEKGPDFTYYQKDQTPYRLVEVMSGKDNKERRQILENALRLSNIPYELDPFDMDGKAGTNVIADLGSKPAVLIIAAHYDRQWQSPGANDNASCVAAALSAYKMLEASGPFEHIKVRFLFTDMEEIGLLGANGYIKNHGVENILGVASFELCGIGDAFGIWDVHTELEATDVVGALQQAGTALGIYHGTHGPVPRNSSDHEPFFMKGIPAVAVTLLPKSDEEILRDYIDNPNGLKWLSTSNRPTIFQTYHTPNDRPLTISPKALKTAARIMTGMARKFDHIAGGN